MVVIAYYIHENLVPVGFWAILEASSYAFRHLTFSSRLPSSDYSIANLHLQNRSYIYAPS